MPGSVVIQACEGGIGLVGTKVRQTVPSTEHLPKGDVAGAQLPDGARLPASRVTLHSEVLKLRVSSVMMTELEQEETRPCLRRVDLSPETGSSPLFKTLRRGDSLLPRAHWELGWVSSSCLSGRTVCLKQRAHSPMRTERCSDLTP